MVLGILILAYFFFGMICFAAFTLERKALVYASIILGLSALTAHGVFIVQRAWLAGRFPFANTYETLILLSFLALAIYFAAFFYYRIAALGGFVGIIASFLLALTSLLSPEIEPLLPALRSNWLLFHVTSAFIGYSAFAVAFGSAALFLLLDMGLNRFLRKRQQEKKVQDTLTYLDELTYRLITIGFPFLTLAISTGAVWANATWGRYWNWDPKEACAFVTWLIYAICLHVRRVEGLKGRPAAFVPLLGFAAVMFTYFGVNFWLASLHAYG